MAIIAEGVPEQHSRLILKEADARGVLIIGPATVGGITPGLCVYACVCVCIECV